jgi:hypothetical protein
LRESQLKGRQTDDVSSKASGNIITFSRAKCYVGRKAKPGNVFFELVIEEIKHNQSGKLLVQPLAFNLGVAPACLDV